MCRLRCLPSNQSVNDVGILDQAISIAASWLNVWVRTICQLHLCITASGGEGKSLAHMRPSFNTPIPAIIPPPICPTSHTLLMVKTVPRCPSSLLSFTTVHSPFCPSPSSINFFAKPSIRLQLMFALVIPLRYLLASDVREIPVE